MDVLIMIGGSQTTNHSTEVASGPAVCQFAGALPDQKAPLPDGATSVIRIARKTVFTKDGGVRAAGPRCETMELNGQDAEAFRGLLS